MAKTPTKAAIEKAKEHLDPAPPAPDTVEDQAGKHEAAHEAMLATLEAVAEDSNITSADLKQLVAVNRDAMIEVFKHRQKPWGQLSAGEQGDVAKALEHASKILVRKIVVILAAQNRPHVRAKLEGYGEDSGVKIKLSLAAMTPEDQSTAILLLHGAVRKEVLIVTADAEAHAGAKKAKIEPDDPELKFPDDNSDLAAAGDAAAEATRPAIAEAEGARQNETDGTAEEAGSAMFGVYDDSTDEWLGDDDGEWGAIEQAGKWTEERARELASEFENAPGDLTVKLVDIVPIADEPAEG